MKKKICILLIIAVAIITISIFCITKISNHKKSDNFIYVGDYNDDLIHEENYLFTDYNELKEIFSLDLVKPEDFDKSNYALIKILYDECSESNIEPYKYKIDGKNIDVLVKYESSCGVCAPNYLYYLLPVDKSIRKVNVNIEYERINEPDCDPNWPR